MKTKSIDQDTIVYQTDCLYRDHGQIVVCRRVAPGNSPATYKVQCNDISRGIYFLLDDVYFEARAIHNRYLNNRYSLDIDFALDRELAEIGIDLIKEMWTDRIRQLEDGNE